MTKTKGKTRKLIVYLSRSSIIMQCCLFLIPLQPSSPSIMPPSGRVILPHASFEHSAKYHSHVGLDHACISNVVICLTCIQTNGSFKVSLFLHCVSLRALVVTSHLVHAPTHVDEIDWCCEINWVLCKEIKVWSVSMIEMTGVGGLWGSEGVYCTFISETNVFYPP